MTGVPPESLVTEGVRSLEVRWIFPGQLEAAVARWFGRFPAATESREDTYLLDPQLPGLSVKVRGGGALEVKAYRGSPGILEVAGRARGRMESWQKWSFPVQPAQPRQRRPARLDAGPQKAAHRPLLTGQRAGHGTRPGAGPAAAVRGGTHRGPHERPALVDPGIRGDRLRQPAAQRTRGHRRARIRPSPARWGGTRPRINPGPMRSGWASGQEPPVTPAPEDCKKVPTALRSSTFNASCCSMLIRSLRCRLLSLHDDED